MDLIEELFVAGMAETNATGKYILVQPLNDNRKLTMVINLP